MKGNAGTATGYLTVHKIKADGTKVTVLERKRNYLRGKSLFDSAVTARTVTVANTPTIKKTLTGTWEVTAGGVLQRVTGTDVFTGYQNGWAVFDDGAIVQLPATVSTAMSGVTAYDGHNLPNIRSSVPAQPVSAYWGSATVTTQQTSQSVLGTAYEDQVAGTYTRERIGMLFPASASNYQVGAFTFGSEAGFGSIVVLDEPIDVAIDEALMLDYTVIFTLHRNVWDTPVLLSDIVNGWPFKYNIESVTGDGTTVRVETSGNPKIHFLTGDKITMDVVPLRRDIVEIVSDSGGIWTVETSSPHGYTGGEEITIEGATNPAYDGTHEIDTIVDSTHFTIDNGTNPGTSAGGTYRLKTPDNYFNGEFVVTDAGTDFIEYASDVTGPAPDIATAILTSPDRAKAYCWGRVRGGTGTIEDLFAQNQGEVGLLNETQHTNLGLPASREAVTPTPGYSGSNNTSVLFSNNPTAGSIQTIGPTQVPKSGGGVDGFMRIKRMDHALYFGSSWTTYGTQAMAIVFETPQPKHHEWQLQFYPLPAIVRRNFWPDFPDFPEPL